MRETLGDAYLDRPSDLFRSPQIFWYVRIDIRIPSRIGLSSNNSTLWESVTEDSDGKERAEREDGEGKHDERLKE